MKKKSVTPPKGASAQPSPEMVNMYNALRDVLTEKGVDISALIQSWTEQFLRSLEPFGADVEFKVLCRRGCTPVSLVLAGSAISFFPLVGKQIRETFGAPNERLKRANEFESTAAMMERAFIGPAASPEDVDRSWPDRPIAKVPIHAPGETISNLRQFRQ